MLEDSWVLPSHRHQCNIFPQNIEKKFRLCVDGFGIRYHSTGDADHIPNTLREICDIATDWEGIFFCGLTFDRNYKAGYVDMEMTGYVPNALNRIQHTPKVSTQYYPHHHTGFKYFTLVIRQYVTSPDETSIISKQDTTFLQSIVV